MLKAWYENNMLTKVTGIEKALTKYATDSTAAILS
jgi:hypothetical protein